MYRLGSGTQRILAGLCAVVLLAVAAVPISQQSGMAQATLLRLDSFTPSGVFDSTFVNGPPNNTTGTFRYSGGALNNPNVTGNNVVLGVLHFTALANGSAQVVASSPDVGLTNPDRDVV